jgi:hypothetical protein
MDGSTSGSKWISYLHPIHWVGVYIALELWALWRDVKLVRNNVKGKRAELGYILLCIVFSKLCMCSLIYKKRGPRTLCFCALTPSLGNPHLLTIREAGTLLSNTPPQLRSF